MSGAKNAFSRGEKSDIENFHHAVDETRNSQPTPEQLLKLLDCQLTLARTKRSTADTNPSRRTALLVGALLLIVGGCGAALLVLQHMLSDLRERGPSDRVRTEQNANF